jgi:hypothetical protein
MQRLLHSAGRTLLHICIYVVAPYVYSSSDRRAVILFRARRGGGSPVRSPKESVQARAGRARCGKMRDSGGWQLDPRRRTRSMLPARGGPPRRGLAKCESRVAWATPYSGRAHAVGRSPREAASRGVATSSGRGGPQAPSPKERVPAGAGAGRKLDSGPRSGPDRRGNTRAGGRQALTAPPKEGRQGMRDDLGRMPDAPRRGRQVRGSPAPRRGRGGAWSVRTTAPLRGWRRDSPSPT